MTIQTYLDNRMAKVGSELTDVERDLAGCIQQTDWTEFSNRASKRVDKAYASFCSSIYWGMVRGAVGGLRTFGMAASSESYFRQIGRASLLAVVPGDMRSEEHTSELQSLR